MADLSDERSSLRGRDTRPEYHPRYHLAFSPAQRYHSWYFTEFTQEEYSYSNWCKHFGSMHRRYITQRTWRWKP